MNNFIFIIILVCLLISLSIYLFFFKRRTRKQVKEMRLKLAGYSQKALKSINKIEFTVDYTKTVKQAIADGYFDQKNKNIKAKNFPTEKELVGKKVEVVGKLFHFRNIITTAKVVEKMHQAGYRPATPMELLALGSSYPDLQRRYLIVALGFYWKGADHCYRVPYLNMNCCDRELGLIWLNGSWYYQYYFLGIPM